MKKNSLQKIGIVTSKTPITKGKVNTLDLSKRNKNSLITRGVKKTSPKKPQLRQYSFEIVLGTSGSGKTYENKIMAETYLKDIKLPVLIFDTNGEYTDYEVIDFDVKEENAKKRGKNIRMFSKARPSIQRILNICKNGERMTTKQMQITYKTIAHNYFGGMLILDDILNYERGFKSQDALGIANTLRHGKDLILSFQGVQHIENVLWAVVKYIRMHNLTYSPMNIASRIPDIIPIQVAYILIQKYYKEAEHYIIHTIGTTLDNYQLNPSDYSDKDRAIADGIFKKYWIKITPARIQYCSKEDFDIGLSIYFRKYNPTEINKIKRYNNCSDEEALQILIDENQHYREEWKT